MHLIISLKSPTTPLYLFSFIDESGGGGGAIYLTAHKYKTVQKQRRSVKNVHVLMY